MTGAARGRLVALEGVDGSGKSTQAERLAASLGAVLTFEPGGTPLGEVLRAVLLDPAAPSPHPRAEALLMAADRAQHVAEVIGPALGRGTWVVTDRYSGSTLAYQGYGRGVPLDELRALVAWAEGGVAADLSVLVDLPADVARSRLAGVAPDRLERLDDAFFARVRDGYFALAGEDLDHWVVVEGDAPADVVAEAVLGAVTARLDPAPAAPGRGGGPTR